MKRRARIAQIVAVLGLFTAADLAADPITPSGVIDQAFDPRIGQLAIFEVNLCCSNSMLQTFTAGMSGTFAGVELLINHNPTPPPERGLSVSLWAFHTPPVPGDVLAGTPLVTATMIPSTIAPGVNWAGVDVLAPVIPITTGGVYGLQVSAFDPVGPYRWVGSRPGYEGGRSFFWVPGTSLSGLPPDIDFGFRTYINQDPVPEPATVGLLAIGLGAMLRRRIVHRGRARRA